MKRSTIFFFQIGWLVGLTALAVIYFLQRWPVKLMSLGSIPVGVVWFGALGAVLISLTGVVEHADDWNPKLYLWHLSRPLMGAALGVVGVLILQAGVLAAGAQPTPAATQATPKNLLYYLVAFLVGYREETFRELIKRLVDLIFAPAAPPPPKPTIASLTPNTGPVAGGGSVKILGSGFVGTLTVAFGSASAKFTVDSDSQISADVPPSAAPGAVSVTVKTKGGSATSSFTYVV